MENGVPGEEDAVGRETVAREVGSAGAAGAAGGATGAAAAAPSPNPRREFVMAVRPCADA